MYCTIFNSILIIFIISNDLHAMQSDFFNITYTKQPSLTPGYSVFGATFNWQNNITLQYNNKKYSITSGTIGFNRLNPAGIFTLITDKQEELSTILPTKIGNLFAILLDKDIIDPFNNAPFVRQMPISAYNRDNPAYKAIENLIYIQFPDSKISYSWTDWAKPYWKPILGVFGLASAGYVYYRYLHAK